MKSFYQSFPIEVIEEPYKIQKKDGTTLEGIRAQFHCPNGFPFSEVKHAMAFAAFLGYAINQRLNKALEQNPESEKQIKATINWINKKAKFHPWEMRHIADDIAKMPEFLDELTALGFSEKQIQKDIKLISILHDIGRLSEVDLKRAFKFNLPQVKGKGYDHAI